MINARKLKPYLIKEKDKPLASLSLVYGQEILLNIEAIEILRNRAKQEKFNDIKVLEIEKPSDWQIVYQEMQPSFFSPKVFLELHLKAKSLDKNVVEFFNSFKKNNDFLKVVVFAPKLEKLDKKKITADFLEIKSLALESDEFREEIIKRLNEKKLNLDNEALEKFILFYEGNFLLANQAIKRLTQYGKTKLNSRDIEYYLEDLALFSILQFRDTVLKKKWLDAFRIAEKIWQKDKNSLTLVNWNLNAICSALLEMKKSPESNWGKIMLELKIFGKTQSLAKKAVNNFKEKEIISLLHLVSKIDRQIKGAEKGDAWISLINYLLYNSYEYNHLINSKV